MKIEIVNWEKYNPRHDVKHTTWFRLQNTWWMDSAITPLDSDGKVIWLVLLSFASQRSCGVYDLDMTFVSTVTGVPEDKLLVVLNKLKDSGNIKIATLRGRYPRRTQTLRGRHATDGRTDGRDGRDERTFDEGSTTTSHPGKESKLSRTPTKPPTIGSQVWESYRGAYVERYTHEPKRNSQVNAVCKQLVDRLGVDDAIKVVRFYLTHNGRWYVQNAHMLRYCLKDAEALHTQMLAGYHMTSVEAHFVDRQQSNVNAGKQAYENLVAKGIFKGESEEL